VQRIVSMGPYLRQIKRVEPVGFGLLEGHDLHFQRPTGIVSLLDGLEQVAAVVVGVLAGDPIRLLLGEILDALIRLEVIFDPEALTFGVDPHKGVA